MIQHNAIMWGGTGQAIVNRPILERMGYKIIAIFDDTSNLIPPFADIPVFLGWDGFKILRDMSHVGFCIAIGNPHGNVRCELHETLIASGLHPINLIHHTAFVSDDATIIRSGCQIMAGAVIQPRVRIGRQCIINTKVSVDHECVLDDGVEIAPGATLCGDVHVKRNGWICAGATVCPRVTIGENSIVAAGSIVLTDVPDNTKVYGVWTKKQAMSYKKPPMEYSL